MPIPPKSIPGQNGNFFARRAARAPGQNQLWPAQPRAIPAKSGYVTGGTPVLPRISNPSFPTFFSMPIPAKLIPGQNGNFLRAAPRARPGKISSGQPSLGPFQPKLGMSPGVPQFDPEFQTHLSLRFSACRFHPNRFPVKTETFLRAAPRARLGKISSGQPSLGPFQPNLGMSPGVPQFDPEFQTHLLLRFSACRFHPNRFPVKTETFLRAAPRARLGKISSGQPSPGLFQPNLGMSPGVPQFDPEFQTHLSLRFSACRFHPNRFPVKTETFLRAAPRARLGKISSGQPSPGPFQPNLGMSPGVPQFDPEFQTHLSLRFSACRFHPNRFPVKTETFLRAAPRARLGKISSGQPSPGPFQPNLGMSPGVPQFDPEFQTHLSLRFSACRFHPNRFPVKTETFLRAAPRARLGKISSGQPSPGPFQPNLGMSPGVPQFGPRISNPSFPTFFSMHFCGIRMLKNVGKDGFEILGQTGVPPLTYPDLAGMALGWAGQN